MLSTAALYCIRVKVYYIILYRHERDDNQKTSIISTALSSFGPYRNCGKTYFPQLVILSHLCHDEWACLQVYYIIMCLYVGI